MLAQQRYDRILELLNKNGIVHNAELVKEMKVSSETVRKDKARTWWCASGIRKTDAGSERRLYFFRG